MKIRIKEETTDLVKLIKDTASNIIDVKVQHFKDNMIIVYPVNSFIRSSYLQSVLERLTKAIPESWLDSPMRISQGGATEGSIVIRLSDEGKKHTSLIREAETNTLQDENPFDDIPSVDIEIDDDNNMTLRLSTFFHSKDNGKIALLADNPTLQDLLMKAIQIQAQKMFRNTVHGILGLPYGLKEADEEKGDEETQPTQDKGEDFTPIEEPTEKKPPAKQFQLLATMISNTKENDQTNILSAMRALPGVTIVNSKAAEPGVDSEGQLRYKTNVDIKIDTSVLEGDIKSAIKKISGVVEFKVFPKAKETTPY